MFDNLNSPESNAHELANSIKKILGLLSAVCCLSIFSASTGLNCIQMPYNMETHFD